jgi:hypothetical protein
MEGTCSVHLVATLQQHLVATCGSTEPYDHIVEDAPTKRTGFDSLFGGTLESIRELGQTYQQLRLGFRRKYTDELRYYS